MLHPTMGGKTELEHLLSRPIEQLAYPEHYPVDTRFQKESCLVSGKPLGAGMPRRDVNPSGQELDRKSVR